MMQGPLMTYKIASEFLPGWASGQYELFGAILKDTTTGQIVAHVQQTGILDQGMSLLATLSNPVSTAATVAGLVQNHNISGKLADIQASMGAMQSLQVAGLVASGVGIGVTVASTAIILKRLGGIEAGLSTLADKVDALPQMMADIELTKSLRNLRTALSRLDEAPDRQNAAALYQEVEKDLDYGFEHLLDGLRDVIARGGDDGPIIAALLQALSLCSEAQMKTLFELGDSAIAHRRAVRHYTAIEGVTFDMPPDLLTDRFSVPEHVTLIDDFARGFRHNLSGRPLLIDTLVDQKIAPQDMLAQAAAETDTPLLFLPHKIAA